MPIRLFTSGTHNSMNGALSFSNEQVEAILASTQKAALEQIPFVLGHPKNNLPIVGWLPKTAIKKYTENEKVSLGFERGDADLSDESMEIIRSQGSNKISVRIEDGAIRHIGLVRKAAVEENNAQNFSQDEMSGVFFSGDDILQRQQSDFSKLFSDLKNDLKQIFKPNNMVNTKKPDAGQQNADMAALIEQNSKLTETVSALQKTVAGFMGKAKATADFSAKEFSQMTAEQKETAATIMADLGSDESKSALKGLLKELAKPAVNLSNGSVTKDFGKPAEELKTVGDVVRAQMKEA